MGGVDAVSRINHGVDVLPSQWPSPPTNPTSYSVGSAQQQVMSTSFDVAVVASHCTAAWVPYTSGDPLPEGSVIGGSFSNGTLLYVAKLQRPGYYNPEAELAFTEQDGVHDVHTVMELLIIM